MRVLIVEDHPDIVANLYGFLEPKGYIGYAGLALASENQYGVIVLDPSAGAGGTDPGLALARRICDYLSASLRYEDREGGSRFTIAYP